MPYDHRVDVTATVDRLRAARSAPPAVETEEALARLESKLFAVPRARKALDRYTLLRRLGQGTSGVVYLADDPKLHRKVAIKLLHPRVAIGEGNLEARARLLREAQALARSPHPNIVAVYDVGTYDTDAGECGVFIVMEYVEGPTLQTWLGAQKRSWHDVLDVFVAAGRGLAAAHRMGVTHRDFKPANVIVGDEGRVRVLDFGLARGVDGGEDTLPADGSTAAKLALEGTLTHEGTVLGTSAFMAPEQHAGRPADPASDQYSFCVALWEGLYGARPFLGRSLEELAAMKRTGPPQPPRSVDVPRRLATVLARGLAVEPTRRWPDMDALTDALARAVVPSRWRTRAALALGPAAVLAFGGWLLLRDDRACSGADERMAEVWNASRRKAIEEAFEAARVSYGGASIGRVLARVEAFANAWTHQHRDACLAGSVRGDQTPAMLDLRMMCLDAKLRDLDALLTVFETADAKTVERAVEAVGRLPQPSQCENVDALLADVRPPDDPTIAAAVEGERAALARARALDQAGRIPDALALAQAVTERAQTLAYAPLLAEALYVRGSLEDGSGHHEEASATLQRSHAIALEAGDDHQAAASATQLVFVEGHRLRRLEVALQWAEAAEAELQRGGHTDNSYLRMAMASAYHTAQRWDDAERCLRDAIAMIEAQSGPDHPRLGTAHNNLGEVLRESGELDRARVELELGRDIYERAYGLDHPRIAQTFNNLASIDLALGELERAEAGFRRVLEIREQSLGPSHPDVAKALANLGIALRRQSRLDEARDVYARALAVFRSNGPDDVRTATLLLGLGKLEHERGDLEAALRHLDQALALQEAELPPEHPDIARALTSRALVLAALGDLPAARSSFARGEASRARAKGSEVAVAEGRFAFARALRDRGEHAEATTLARRALEELPADTAPELRRDVTAWLAEGAPGYPRSRGASE